VGERKFGEEFWRTLMENGVTVPAHFMCRSIYVL
jgi:hypothetical protein